MFNSLACRSLSWDSVISSGILCSPPSAGLQVLVAEYTLRIPLSSTFGRRPVLLASTLVSLASCIWRAEARSYNSFMGASILNGIGAGPCEVRQKFFFQADSETDSSQTLQPQIITDYVFLHDRGKFNALYFSMFFGSLNVCPGNEISEY